MTVGVLAVKLLGDTTDFTKKWKRAEGTLKRVGTTAVDVGRKMRTVGKGFTLGATLPIVTALGIGVKSFASFDQAMTQSLAIMGTVTDGMRKDMAELAKTLSTQTTFAAKELAQAYFFLASAGMNAEQAMRSLGTVARFAQAGNFDLSRATSLLAGSLSALGMKSKDAEKNMQGMTQISDVLVRANNLADQSTEQFATALTRSGGAMKAFGVDLEQGVAVLAAYAEVQRKAEVGGEAFARILRILIPSANNNEDAFKELGIAVFDSSGNLRNMADILFDIEQGLKGMSTREKSAALEALGFKKRIQGAILPLIGMSKSIREYEKQLESAGGTTLTVAEKQLQSLANRLKIVKNRFSVIATEIGEAFVPSLEKIIAKVKDVATWFEKLDDSQRASIVKWGLIVAAIGPVIFALGSLVMFIGKLMLLSTILGALQISLLAIAGSIALWAGFGVALVATVAAFGSWRKAVDGVRKSQEQLLKQKKQIQAEFGSIENVRGANRERYARDKIANDEMARILKRETGLQDKIARLRRVASARGLSNGIADRVQKQIDRLQAVMDKSNKGKVGFFQKDEDIEAQVKFAQKFQEALLDQLPFQKKINQLMKERAKIMEEMAGTQAGSKAFFELGEEALDVELKLKDSLASRIDRLKDLRQQVSTPQFAGAAEVGTVEAYRARIKSDAQNDVAKNTGAINKRIAELVAIGKDQLFLLQQGASAQGNEFKVVELL